MTTAVRIEFHDEDEAAEFQREIQAGGHDAERQVVEGEGDAIAPLLVVLASVGAASIIADYMLRTGRVIDTTTDPVTIRRDRGLERNEVLFVVAGEGGKKEYSLKDAPKADLVAIIEGGVKNVVDKLVSLGATENNS